MKSLAQYLEEKLIIKKNKSTNYKYFPKTKEELKDIILQRIKDEGNEVDLNNIDVSKITDMEGLFYNLKHFNGDISNWDVSNVTYMNGMFWGCKNFNQDISAWDVSNVTNMRGMFGGCESFNQDISGWDVSNVINMRYMFANCPIKEKYKPKFSI